MYYGFLNDTIFKEPLLISQVDKAYPACVMDRTVGNYFHDNTAVRDTRVTRLSFNNRNVLGQLAYCYDANKHDNDIFTNLTTVQINAFFKILEIVELANNRTTEELEEELATDMDTSAIYVPNTLKIASTKIKATIYNLGSTKDTYDLVLPVYFDVTIKFDTKLDQEVFRVYMGREYFLKNYPLSTINKIIEPCDHSYLLDPTKSPGVVDMLIKSNEHSFAALDSSIVPEDHTGLYTFRTKYIDRFSSTTQMVPFGVLYQGAKPSTLEIRKVIREQLLAYGTAPKETWEAILPELFVTATWYVIPFWDNTFNRPERIAYPSVGNIAKLKQLIPDFFPELEDSFINKYQEILLCGKSEIIMTTIPDPLNEKEFSIQKIHPTYQYHMLQDGSAFNNMDPETRDFNTRLNNCVAVAMGESTTTTVQNTVVNDLTWHAFVSNNVEYLLLSRESYRKYLGITDL